MDASEALTHADSGIALTRDLLLEYPADQMLKQRLGSLMAGGAAAYRNLGELTHAASYYADSIQIREELLRDDPHNSGTQRNLMIAYGNYATMLGIPRFANLDQPDEARIYAGKAVAIAREMVAADANDVTARRDLGMCLGRLGMIDPAANGDSQSLASLEEAISLIEPIARANPKSSEIAGQVAMIAEYEGTRQQALARNADALTSYRKSMSILQPFVDVHNGTVTAEYVTDEENIAVLEASLGHNAKALEEANQAIGHAQGAGDHNMHTDSQTAVLGKAWAMMAITQSKLGMVQDARESASDAMRFWSTVTRKGMLLTYRKLMAETQLIADLPAPQ